MVRIGNARKIGEVDDVEEREESKVRRRADSSEPQKLLKKNTSSGVAFISVMNQRKRFFLPSTKNDFGIVRVKRVLTDSGCSSLLLPLESTQELRRIMEHYADSCAFSIALSKNAGGKSPVLLLKKKDSFDTAFPVNLCIDIIGPPTICVSALRFALCAEDVAELRGSCRKLMPSSQLGKLEGQVVSAFRRQHALLGQSVLHSFLLLKCDNTEFYVNPLKYAVPTSWEDLRNQMETLGNQLSTHKPEDFDDWDDDDFAYEDDEFLTEDD